MRTKKNFMRLAHVFYLFILAFFTYADAFATHFRFGHLTWQPRPEISATTVEFTFMGAWRRDGYFGSAPDGRPQVGDIIFESIGGTRLGFGDGTSTNTLYFEITAFSAEQNWIIGIARETSSSTGVIRKTYASPRDPNGLPWVANVSGCCRISALRNGADGSYRLESRVDLSIPNVPPVSNVPPIISCTRGAACSFFVPAVDGNRDTLRWSFTPTNLSGLFSQPGNTQPDKPLSIDSSTGLVSWHTLSNAPLGFYALSVTIEDLGQNGAQKSNATVDVLLQLQDINNPAPVFRSPPTPPSNSSVLALVNQPMTIEIQAGDSNPSDLVTLNHVGLPPGAQFNVVKGNPAIGTFLWTPTLAHVGEHIVTFTAIDSRNSAGLPIAIKLNVVNPPIRNVKVSALTAAPEFEFNTAGFSKAPAKIEPLGNGTRIDWEFFGFNIGQIENLDFNGLIKNLVSGEQRIVTRAVELEYEDINGNKVKKSLGSQFVKVLPTDFEARIFTDQANYGPNKVADITAAITNRSQAPSRLNARISVRDLAGKLVKEIGSVAGVEFVGNETKELKGFQFLTADTFIGEYRAVVELLDAQNQKLDEAASIFKIVSTTPNLAAAQISVDKQAYQPTETVTISNRVTNLTQNDLLSDLRIVTMVTNPDETLRFSKTETLLQLLQGAMKDYRYGIALNGAQAGQYGIAVSVLKADGTPLTQANGIFMVASSANSGDGLAGTLNVSPKLVPLETPLVISFTVKNNGNSALTNLPLKISILDPVNQTALAEYPYEQTIEVGASYTAGISWLSNGVVKSNYIAVLSTTVNGKTIVLAQEAFQQADPPIKLAVNQQPGSMHRVLALASCVNSGGSDSDDGCVDDDNTDDDSDNFEDDHDGDDTDNETDCDDASDNNLHLVCAKARARAIQATLHEMGVTHFVTTKRSTFKRALRSGLYDTYWISGNQSKLYGSLAAEVREAVFAGNTLLLDATFSGQTSALEQASGVRYLNMFSERKLGADMAAPVFTVQRLATNGAASKIELKGASPLATFYNSSNTAVGTGIAGQAFGQGRTLTFAFDLLKSARAQPLWKGVLASGLVYATPTVPSQFTPGALVSTKTGITNQSQPVDVDVKSTLPTGARHITSYPIGNIEATANTVQWAFKLAEAESKNLFLTIQVPTAAGEYVMLSLINTTKDGITKPYGDALTLPIKVVTAPTNASNAINALKAFTLPTTAQQDFRNQLVTKLEQAVMHFNYNTRTGYTTSIRLLTEVASGLPRLTAVDTNAVRQDVGRVLKEAQWRWTLTPPPVSDGDGDS